MRITHAVALVTIMFVGPLVVPGASAQITRIDFQVVESPAFDGRSFGSVGQYERLRGIAYGEVDPDNVRHREIVNLDKAPLNERGRVEYSTTVEIHRPIDLASGNRAIYHIVPNRGRANAGDALLREMGFTVVQVGWQGDLTATDTNIVPVLPADTMIATVSSASISTCRCWMRPPRDSRMLMRSARSVSPRLVPDIGARANADKLVAASHDVRFTANFLANLDEIRR